MDIFSLITLIGGLAFFLYGMNVLSGGLERMAGSKLEGMLRNLTSNRFKSILLGMVVTAAIQSSSAVTVMLVGLVNSGIMTTLQSIGVIMGSNMGTTMTAWIFTLIGVESDNAFVKLLKPENFSLVFAFVGIILIMITKSSKKKDVGSILIGFAVLMYGMKLMSNAVAPLSDEPAFVNILTAFKNPILGVLAGALITAVIQSSSASVGILQALALTGAVSYGAAIPIIMGQNIGTCITALISSIGSSRNAKRVSVVHVIFNLIGTTVWLVIYGVLNAIFKFAFVDMPIDTVGIAAVHSVFNISTTLLLSPFVNQLDKLAKRILPDAEAVEKEEIIVLDTRLLNTPSVAISECDRLTVKMSEIAEKALKKAISALNSYTPETESKVMQCEGALDKYEDTLGTFLVQLSSKRLSQGDALKVSKSLHVIGDFERLGDHAANLMQASKELYEKKLAFSESAQSEISVLLGAILEILELTHSSYSANDIDLAMKVEPLEQTIDKLVAKIKGNHIKRLTAGDCSIELGFILSDVLNNLERISDHCSNIAVAVIELSHSSFDTHKYLSVMRSENEEYKETYRMFNEKYAIKEMQ